MKAKTRVAVFINEENLSSTFHTILTKSNQFNYIGKFSDKQELLKHVEKNPVDILIVDGSIIVSDNVILKEIKSLNEEIKLIGIIKSGVEIGIEKLLLEEVQGYVSFSQNMNAIIKAIKVCSLGGIFLSEDIKKKMLEVMSSEYINLNKLNLSPRERQIASLYCEGLTYREIASKLFISTETVKTHLKNFHCKFKSAYLDRTELRKKHKLSRIKRNQNSG